MWFIVPFALLLWSLQNWMKILNAHSFWCISLSLSAVIFVVNFNLSPIYFGWKRKIWCVSNIYRFTFHTNLPFKSINIIIRFALSAFPFRKYLETLLLSVRLFAWRHSHHLFVWRVSFVYMSFFCIFFIYFYARWLISSLNAADDKYTYMYSVRVCLRNS